MTKLRIRWARVATWLVALLLISATLVAPSSPRASAATLPGGQPNWAVTLAGLPAVGATTASSPPFVRLAMYYFNTNGTLYEGFWYWSWATTYPKVNTGTMSCASCPIHTVDGFESGDGTYPKTLTGSYVVNSDSTVSITWINGTTEKWKVSTTSDPGVAAADLVSSNYGATTGKGFGSSVGAKEAAPIDASVLKKYVGRYDSWQLAGGSSIRNTGVSSMDLVDPNPRSTADSIDFKICGGCISGYRPASAKACTACPASPDPNQTTTVVRYVLGSEGGRKNYYEHYCSCLSTTTCYNGGSHVKPQLQVLSRDPVTGKPVLRGWVGVEVSHYDVSGGYMASHWHVDV